MNSYRARIAIESKRSQRPRVEPFVVPAETPVMNLDFWLIACTEDRGLLRGPLLWIERQREALDAATAVVHLELVELSTDRSEAA